MKKFKIRKWLNNKYSASTGSITIYDGPSSWNKKEKAQFIEVADCHVKARLHRTKLDTKEMWLEKVETMINSLEEYKDFLKK